MEPVSLGVGIVGLAALFNSVVEACNQVNAYRHAELDLHFVATRLENQKHILNDWAEKVGIDDETILSDHHPRLDNPKTCRRVKDTLEVIREFIERVNYNLVKRSKAWSKKFRSSRTSLDVPDEPPSARPRSPLRKALWAIVDKENILPNVDQLDALVNELHRLVPPDNYASDGAELSEGSAEVSQDDISGSTESKLPFDEDPYVSVQRREEVKVWLNAFSTEGTFEALRDCRTENTCEWVLDNPTYCKWLEVGQDLSQPRTLWLNAPPGCGKSVLSAFLIDELAKAGTTLYFFCSGSEEVTRKPISILRSCVMQATKHREALAIAYDHKRKSDNIHASEPDLWRLFQELLRLNTRLTFVIDGFDECSDYETNAARKTLFGRSTFLRRIHQSFFASQSRLLIVSRFLPDIASALGREHGNLSGPNAAYEHKIREEDVTADVERFAMNLVRDQLPQSSSVQQDNVGRQLAKKSEGAFLWVLLQRPLLTPVDTIEQVQQRISSAPTELPDVYNSDWQRIQALPELDRTRSLLLLRWVTFATRPLEILELFDAIKIQDDEQPHRTETSSDQITEAERPDAVQSLRSELTRLAGTFAFIRQTAKGSESATSVMEITHITAKWFLFRMLKNKSPLGASPVKDNALATLCLKYLNQYATWNSSGTQDPRLNSHPFRAYAAMNWPAHADPLREGGNEFETLAQSFFSPTNRNWLSWREFYEKEQQKSLPAYFITALRQNKAVKSHEPGSLTYYASHFGLNRILRSMDGNKSLDLNKLGGLYGTPLQAACVESHLPTVLWLLRYGAQHTLPDNIIGSALHTAVYSGNVLLVAALLRKGADVNHTDAVKRQPLHIAAYQGHSEIVGRLIAASGSVNSQDSTSWYPLITASRFGHRTVVDKLLEAGADTTRCTKEGANAVMMASIRGDCAIIRRLVHAGARTDRMSVENWPALFYAADSGHLDAVKLLLSYRDSTDDTSAWNSRALGLAARRGIKPIVEEFLQRTRYSLNVFVISGRLAIHLAAAHGHADIIKSLCSRGADINALTYVREETPLLLASSGGHESAVELLLTLGAKQTADVGSSTPLQLATRSGSLAVTKMLIDHGADIHVANNVGATSIYIASGRGFADIARLLITHGANIHTPKKGGWTAIQYAAEQGFTKSVELLLDHGAEINSRTDELATSLYVASGLGHLEVIKLLIERGADIHIPNKNKWTPLHYASERGHLAIAEILINKGADINALNSIKWTPVHVAARYGRSDIYDKLVESGADANVIDASNRTPLSLAVTNNHFDLVRKMAKAGINLNQRGQDGNTVLIKAVLGDQADMVECLLEAGVDPEATNQIQYRSPLEHAIRRGNLAIVSKLLQKSSPPHEGFSDRFHPLRQATQKGSGNIIQALVDAGFKISSVDNAGRTTLHTSVSEATLEILRELPGFLDAARTVDHLGCSILHYHARKSDPSVVNWAVEEVGLDVNKQDNQGWTPLHWAAYFKNDPVIHTLLELDADPSIKDAQGWQAARIAKFVEAKAEVIELLQEGQEPKENAEKPGVILGGYCDSCVHDLIDSQLHCKTCANYDLCFRCAHDKHILHPVDHEFVEDFRY